MEITFRVNASFKQLFSEEEFVRMDQDKNKQLNFGEFIFMDLAYVIAKKEEFDMLDANRKLILFSINKVLILC